MKKFAPILCAAGLCLSAQTAIAAERAMIVLDASGSMWGEINGKHKIDIARETLRSVLGSVPVTTELGLIAYGHREKGSCSDIEQVIPAFAGSGPAIAGAVTVINPKGKTPLSAAVQQAAQALKYTEEKATVILITDGLETCDADPCAVATSLEQTGVNFTTHVVGFGLSDEEGKQVACLAENTGGVYKKAADASDLGAALQQTVVQAPAPQPVQPVVIAQAQPEPAPAPTPVVLDKNLHVRIFTAEGQPLESNSASIEYFQVVNGKAGKKLRTDHGKSQLALLMEPGEMIVRVSLGKVSKDIAVNLTKTELTTIDFNMNVAVVAAQIIPAEGADPFNAGKLETFFGGKKQSTAYNKSSNWVPAGEVTIKGYLGNSVGEKTINAVAGQRYDELILVEAGLLDVQTVYAEGGPNVESGSMRITALSAKKNLQGKRKSFASAYGGKKRFTLKPDDYVIETKIGSVIREFPIKISAGELTELVANVEVGILAVEAPGAKRIDIVGTKKNLEGKVKKYNTTYNPKFAGFFAAGEYKVVVEMKDGQIKESVATVKIAERSEVAIK